MDRAFTLGMFHYDEAPRNKNKAFAGSDNYYVLSDDAKKMGELLQAKIKIHKLRSKELEEMAKNHPDNLKWYREEAKHRFPVNEATLERWEELADFMINSRGYWVR